MLSSQAGWAIALIITAATALCSGAAGKLEQLAERDRLNALTERLLAFVQAKRSEETHVSAPSAESTLRADMGYVYLARARRALDQGDLLGARKSLDRLLVSPGNSPSVGQEAIQISRELESIGEKMLQQAQDAWSHGDSVATVIALRKVRAAMAGRKAGELARQWLEAAQEHDKLRPAIREADARTRLDALQQHMAALAESNEDNGGDLKVVDLTRTDETDPVIETLETKVLKLPESKRATVLAALRELAGTYSETPTGQHVAQAIDNIEQQAPANAKNSASAADEALPGEGGSAETPPRVVRID